MEYEDAYKMIEEELINLSEVFWDKDSDAVELRMRSAICLAIQTECGIASRNMNEERWSK